MQLISSENFHKEEASISVKEIVIVVVVVSVKEIVVVVVVASVKDIVVVLVLSVVVLVIE